MVIYLRHKVHGTKVAIAEAEALADEKNGWERFQVGALLTPKTVEAIGPAVEVPTVDELAMLRAQYEAQRGQKPHHKKSLATLKAELYGNG